MKILEKINVSKIIKNHISTLQNNSSKKAGFDEYLTFLILPVVIAGILIWQRILIDLDYSRLIITCLSVLVGLLLNVNVLVFNIVKRDNTDKLKIEIVKQLFSNISFAILLSVFGIIAVLTSGVKNLIFKYCIHFLIYFILLEFFIILLMILKRMYILFNYEIEN